MADTTRLPKIKQARQFRYSAEADLWLLREAVAVNPFGHGRTNGLGWQEIASRLAQTDIFPPTLTPRTVRERTHLLLEKFKKKQKEKESSSAIEEVTTVPENGKELLLEELSQLQEQGTKGLTCLQKRHAELSKLLEQKLEGQTFPHENNIDERGDMGQIKQDQAMIAMFPVREYVEGDDVEILALNRSMNTLSRSQSPEPSPEKKHLVEENMWQLLKLREKRRLCELEYLKQKVETERLERQEESERIREKDQLDREERKSERERQREREELDRQERREEAKRQKERDEQDREDRRQMLQLLITLIDKK